MTKKLHVLFLSRKDPLHPKAGGAERVILEYARYLVHTGHKVTWFGPAFPGSQKEEQYEGISIVRKYNTLTIYLFGWMWYLPFIRHHHVDIVVDEAGGIPLLSALFAPQIPKVFFIHHIPDKEWHFSFAQPLAYMAKTMFSWILLLYKKVPTICVSQSTCKELLSLGWEKKSLHVIPNTIDKQTPTLHAKTHKILFMNRLVPIKRVEDVISAFVIFSKKHPNYTLDIRGKEQDLQYIQKLRNMVHTYKIDDKIFFKGEYNHIDMQLVLSTYMFQIVSSYKEGFGLVVLEGNVYGVPAIAYDVPGLRDSVVHGINGVLVPDADISGLAHTLAYYCDHMDMYTKLVQNTLEHISQLPSRSEQGKKFLDVIHTYVK